MQDHSLEILKGLSTKLHKGTKGKFPKRRTDFLFQDEQRFPLYPIDRWIDTYNHFSKSENLDKTDNPIDIIKTIIDFRDIYYANEMDLLKSKNNEEIGLFFHIRGNKIKTAILKRISELKNKLSVRMKLLSDQANLTNMITIEAEPTPKAENDWEVKNIENQIKKLQSVADNIDTSKTFKLTEWDLERYGL